MNDLSDEYVPLSIQLLDLLTHLLTGETKRRFQDFDQRSYVMAHQAG